MHTNPIPDDTEIRYSSDLELSDQALELVNFDFESVSQVIQARAESKPDVWLARPEGYQADGHVLRDSETIRLIALCIGPGAIYATDGCNSCRHGLRQPLTEMSDDALRTFSSETQLPYTMLRALAGTVT